MLSIPKAMQAATFPRLKLRNLPLLPFLLCAAAYGAMPAEKSITANVGFAFETPRNTLLGEEDQLASGFYSVFRDSAGNVFDTSFITFKYYVLAFNAGLSYQFSRSFSVGVEYEYSNLTQSPSAERELSVKPASLLTLNKVGPTLTWWKPIGAACFAPTLWPNIGFGELTRIPVMYNGLPNKAVWMEAYHQPISVMGFGAGLSLPLVLFTESGLFLKLAAKYDFFSFGIEDNLFIYPSRANCNNFGLSASVGFASSIEETF